MTSPEGPAWTASPDDVGQVIARLVPDRTGQVSGYFDDTTVPHTEQVRQIAASVATEVAAVVPQLPEQLHPLAQRVVALGAGAQIADAFFPEASREYVARLDEQYERALTRLVAAVAETQADAGEADSAFEVFTLSPPVRPELTEASWS